MKILLTHGYFLKEDERELQIMKPYVPLGILYVSAWLEQNGYDNEVFDATFASFEELKVRILKEQPEVIGIYTNLMTKLNVLKLIRFIKEAAGLKTKVILGGPEVRHHKKKFLEYGADVIVVGEGEETMLELVKCLEEGGALGAVTGIVWKNERGEIVENSERALRKDLDELPFPNRKKINLNLYFDAWEKAHGERVLSMSTMRGCPYDCSWCSRAVYGKSYRRRSPKMVVKEILELQQLYKFDRIWFVDDVFTVNYPWLREFVDEVKREGLKIEYEIITRADRMNEEIVKLLKESGCFRVWIGAESGSQKIIDAMSRRVKVGYVRDMIRLTQQQGMEAGTFIMLGYPGETIEDIKETIDHLVESNPMHYTLTVAYPIKGTPLYSEVENLFVEDLEWESSTDRMIDFKRTYSRRFYDYAIRWVYNEVYAAKALKRGERGSWLKLKMKSAVVRGLMMMG